MFRFGKELLWTMIWVFIVLILGFFILSFVSSKFSGNILGSSASKIEELAQPH